MSWKGQREEFQKDLEKMRVKIKSKRIKRTASGKETGRLDCRDKAQGNYTNPDNTAELRGETGMAKRP